MPTRLPTFETIPDSERPAASVGQQLNAAAALHRALRRLCCGNPVREPDTGHALMAILRGRTMSGCLGARKQPLDLINSEDFTVVCYSTDAGSVLLRIPNWFQSRSPSRLCRSHWGCVRGSRMIRHHIQRIIKRAKKGLKNASFILSRIDHFSAATAFQGHEWVR